MHGTRRPNAAQPRVHTRPAPLRGRLPSAHAWRRLNASALSDHVRVSDRCPSICPCGGGASSGPPTSQLARCQLSCLLRRGVRTRRCRAAPCAQRIMRAQREAVHAAPVASRRSIKDAFTSFITRRRHEGSSVSLAFIQTQFPWATTNQQTKSRDSAWRRSKHA